ncbi:hypothetical protein D3C80_1524250 [compost metagenome]
MLDNLTHTGHRNDLHSVLHIVRNVRQVLGIFFRNEHLLDAAAQGCKELFLEAADWQNTTTQCDFTGHGNILGNRNAGHDRHDGSCHRHTC